MGLDTPSPGGLLRLFVIITTVTTVINAWEYNDQDNWSGTCSTGKHQSPINLRLHQAVKRNFNALQFINYDKKYTATMKNNGHSIAVTLNTNGDKIIMRGGGLPYDYVVDHLHFHWSSEHTVHSNRYPLELHIVHYANLYNSTTGAVSSESDQGLAVLGILYDLNIFMSNFDKNFMEGLKTVKKAENANTQLSQQISLNDFLPVDTTGFFRYEGSLTTPGCNEVVIWTVLPFPGYVSSEALSEFHSVQTAKGPLKENFRHLQKLNGRVVTLRESTMQSLGYKNYVNYSLLILLIVLNLFK